MSGPSSTRSITAGSTWAQHHRLTPNTLNQAAPSSAVPGVLWWNPAWFSVAAAVALSVIGVSAINLTEPVGAGENWIKQLVFLAVGLVACAACAMPSPRTWRYIAYPSMVGAIGLLVFVLIPFIPHEIVRPRNGARRWINLVLTDFQPSELAKIVLVLALAHYLRYRKNYRTLSGLLVPFAIMLMPMGLILVEPDLGTAMLFGPVLFAMLLAAGAKLKHLFTIAGLGAITIALIATVSLLAAQRDPPSYPVLEKHQVDRIQGLVNQIKGDRRHADTINYQAFKAMTIIGSGGFFGLGPERSRLILRTQRLPEDHNDMVFAVVVNRWGFVGATAMVGIYLVYLVGLVMTAATSMNPFGRLVCVGFATIIASQMVVNIGMNIGLLPITGMTLPFVSYGGSSLVANFAMTGIALSIALRPAGYFARPSFEFDERREGLERVEYIR